MSGPESPSGGQKRIAVRQLERAQLYVSALTALDLEAETRGEVESLLTELEALRRRFLNTGDGQTGSTIFVLTKPTV